MNLHESDGSAIPVIALLVSPYESDHVLLRDLFADHNWRLYHAYDCHEACSRITQEQIPVVICDGGQLGGNWKAILDTVAALSHPPRLIVASRTVDDRLWAEVLNLGGYDVLQTPFDASEVGRDIVMAWHSWSREASESAGCRVTCAHC